MPEILSAPPVWIGLGLLLLLLLVAGGNSGRVSKARLARVTRKQGARPTTAAQSLRKRNPNQDSPLGQALASMHSISKLQVRLETAGMTSTPQQFLGIAIGIALATVFLFAFILHKSIPIGILFGVLLGLLLPNMAVSRKIKKRQRAFLRLFPEAIDLMVRGLRAGLPIAESFQVVSRELPPPMGDTFAAISQQTALGVPMEAALSAAAKKLSLTEFDFFVTTIILQRETGGNLGEILNNLSEMLRQRHTMKLKIHALASEARASAYIVGALPFAVFAMLEVVSPQYLSPLFTDYRGNESLAAAAISMGLGAFIMRQMTQLEI